VTGESLGLLIEESRTNFILNSNSATVSGFTAFNVSTINSVINPDGSTGTTQIQRAATGTSNYRLGDTSSGTAGTTYTGSIYVRTLSGTSSIAFDTNDANIEVFNVTEEWTRLEKTGVDANNNFRFMDLYQNDIYSDTPILIWGAQVEEGSFPTSYIPTTGSTATRAADVASIEGTNFSSWYNQSEGTVFIRDKVNPLDSFPMAWVLQNTTNTTDGSVSNFLSPSGSWVFDSRNNGANFDLFRSNVPGSFVKRAAGLKNDDIALALNGSITTLQIGNITASTSILYIGQRPPVYFYNGHISRLAYFPTRKTDQELIDLTT